LARGAELPDAVQQGKDFVTAAIDDSFALGAGLGPVGHFWRVQRPFSS
jgi:hydroxymethylpyrimidine/phosphomethylpyrimidine kinase